MGCICSYAIHNAQAPDAFLAAVSWHYPSHTLDAPAMHGALQTLRSERPRDLSALARVERHRHLRELRADVRDAQAAGNTASAQAPVKLQHVQDVRAWRERDMVYVEIQADRFLYGQVRCIAPIGPRWHTVFRLRSLRACISLADSERITVAHPARAVTACDVHYTPPRTLAREHTTHRRIVCVAQR
jgi:tRNA U38,U39,U40 pseudouridine synthase TruA